MSRLFTSIIKLGMIFSILFRMKIPQEISSVGGISLLSHIEDGSLTIVCTLSAFIKISCNFFLGVTLYCVSLLYWVRKITFQFDKCWRAQEYDCKVHLEDKICRDQNPIIEREYTNLIAKNCLPTQKEKCNFVCHVFLGRSINLRLNRWTTQPTSWRCSSLTRRRIDC